MIIEDREVRLRDALSGMYSIYHRSGLQGDALSQVSRLLSAPEAATSRLGQDQLKQGIEILSNGENTVIFDEHTIPSVMVRVSTMSLGNLLDCADNDRIHPAFVMNGRPIKEIWVSKFPNCLIDECAASLPMMRPHNALDYDQANALCRKKGAQWGLMPFQLRMALALHCRKRGFHPHGNTDMGRDVFHPEETGSLSGEGLTLTGSGPVTWSHDGTPGGIFDLVGNVNEWDSGLRTLCGEIQIMDMDSLFSRDADMSPNSPAWRAINAQGKLVPPGSKDTLKYDAYQAGIRLTTQIECRGVGNCGFSQIAAQDGLQVPEEAHALGLFPPDNRSGCGPGWRWIDTEGEALPLCGGAHRAVDHGGIFFVGMTKRRNERYELTGFRSIYIDQNSGGGENI